MKWLTFLPALFFTITYAYSQDVHYNYDRNTNFGSYKTYQWVDLPGPGGQVPDQLIDRDIKRAVDEQLAQKVSLGSKRAGTFRSATTQSCVRRRPST